MKQLNLYRLQPLDLRKEMTTEPERSQAKTLDRSLWETAEWFIGWLKLARKESGPHG